MVEARDEITQLVENSDLNLETQAGEQNKLMIQSVGLDETIRSQISDSDGQPESPEVAAQIASNSNAKEDAFEPSTGRPHNELSSRALEKKNASEPSTTTMEALSSGSKDSERTTESGQTTTSADHSNTIKKWRKGGSFSNERARKLRDDKEELKEEVRELKDEVQALKQEREEREARFQEAQEDALKLLERDAINALPDNVVRNEFKQIFAGSRQWTKKWAVSDTNVVAFNDIKRMIRIMLTGHLDKKSVSTKGMQAAYSGTLNQRRILTTLVTRHLACSLFQRPFFYLRNLNRSSASHHKSIENALQQVQDLGIASGEKLQNQWRAITVRMISAQSDELASSIAGSAHTFVQDWKEAAYTTFSEQVVTSGKALLRHVDAQEAETRSSELIALFQRAGKLACQLQSQYVKTRVLFSPHEMDRFSVDSDTMEPHTSMGIEQGDHSWDGKEIDLVITPAVLAYGNEHGENYSNFKVWSKAVVWMEAPRESKPRRKQVTPGEGKSSAGTRIKKTGGMGMAIIIPDDDVEQSTMRTAGGADEEVKQSGKKKDPQKLGQIERQAKGMANSSFNDGRHSGPRAAEKDSKDDENRSNIEVSLPLSHELSTSMNSYGHRAERITFSANAFKSQITESAEGASEDVKVTTLGEAGRSKKRDWSDDDYSENSSPRTRKRLDSKQAKKTRSVSKVGAHGDVAWSAIDDGAVKGESW